jgi:hypothetical protein
MLLDDGMHARNVLVTEVQIAVRICTDAKLLPGKGDQASLGWTRYTFETGVADGNGLRLHGCLRRASDLCIGGTSVRKRRYGKKDGVAEGIASPPSGGKRDDNPQDAEEDDAGGD